MHKLQHIERWTIMILWALRIVNWARLIDFFDPHITIFGNYLYVDKTKNRPMVSIHSQGVTEILAIYRMTKFDFPPNFLKGLMHIFPTIYNTAGSKLDSLASKGHFLQQTKKSLKKGCLGGNESTLIWNGGSILQIVVVTVSWTAHLCFKNKLKFELTSGAHNS